MLNGKDSLWKSPPSALEALLPEARVDRGLPAPEHDIQLSYCVVEKMYKEVGARRLWIQVGDDVEVHLHDRAGASSWCRVAQIVAVRHFDPSEPRNTLHRLWVIPTWYCSTLPGDGDSYSLHRVRKTPLVRKLQLGPDQIAWKPILARECQVQVCVTHSCIRDGLQQSCGLQRFCNTHNRWFSAPLGCKRAACLTFPKDVHDEVKRPVWEIVDRATGMSGCSTRGSH